MNSPSLGSENVTSKSTSLKGNNQGKGLSQLHDTDGGTFDSESRPVSSLAFLPILGIIIFLICSLLKVYKWSRDSARWKARGDVEFGDEAEVNYGIISVGDKDFCQIDIRSDGASVYDTVNSFRLFGNGYATQLSETYPYHDTVTSYKSLLMQKADGNQYDSVKSYKAFLQKVTQNKDLAVEVKLLENYPVHSKSAEHGIFQEVSSERSEVVAARRLGTLPLKKQLHKDGQFCQFEKKRPKRRRASGDLPTAARKRSSSNKKSRRVTSPACSLPSVRNPLSLSGDSEEDIGIQQSFRIDGKKYGTKRKNILPRAASGGKMFKVPGSAAQSAPGGHSSIGVVSIRKRKRHFSADSVGSLKKAEITLNKNSSKVINNEAGLNDSFKIAADNKIMTQSKRPGNMRMEESSSENPNSLHSSDTDVPSDVIVSGSDNDAKKNMHFSTVSYDQVLDNDVFVSFDSRAEIPSSSETFENSPKRSLSETKIIIAHAREEFFKNKLNNAFSLMPSDISVSCPSAAFLDNQNSGILSRAKTIPIDLIQISGHENHSISTEEKKIIDCHCATGPTLESPGESICVMSKSLISLNTQQASDILKEGALDIRNIEGRKSQNLCNIYKVQRFHVTFVNSKISSPNSD